ncbi:hypothetical protein GF361_05360 [Candidatus Woesearchaeota archaeon]|nr:hypothetical protein [Candidatus Woesearchaeota archaeon]
MRIIKNKSSIKKKVFTAVLVLLIIWAIFLAGCTQDQELPEEEKEGKEMIVDETRILDKLVTNNTEFLTEIEYNPEEHIK